VGKSLSGGRRESLQPRIVIASEHGKKRGKTVYENRGEGKERCFGIASTTKEGGGGGGGFLTCLINS